MYILIPIQIYYNKLLTIGVNKVIVVNQDDNHAEIDINSKVLHFIQDKPACHLRQIKKELNISMGTANII